MKIGKLLFAFLFVSLISLGLVIALKPNFVSTEVVPSKDHAVVSIPEHAVEIAPDVFSLGTSLNSDGKIVEGFMFIDRKENFARNGNAKAKGSSCYSFIAAGAKWKIVENYVVDPANNAGLNEQFVRDNIAFNINKWETASGKNILGYETNGTVDLGNIGNLNGKNEVAFADISENNVIGVTIVWGIFSGPTRQRELVEWDQIYDDADFNWSSTGEVGKMDFENIANHEIGHAFGLSHPNDSCTEETMFRFASLGETKKRTLEAGDIEGIRKLYS